MIDATRTQSERESKDDIARVRGSRMQRIMRLDSADQKAYTAVKNYTRALAAMEVPAVRQAILSLAGDDDPLLAVPDVLREPDEEPVVPEQVPDEEAFYGIPIEITEDDVIEPEVVNTPGIFTRMVNAILRR